MKARKVGLLVLFLVCLVLAGGKAFTKTKLNFVFWLWAPEALEGWKNTIKEFIAENPDIDVNYIAVPGATWGEYLDKVSTLIAGGEKPDVMWVATEGMLFLLRRNLMQPLDAYIDRDRAELQEFFDDVAPALLEAMVFDEKRYALPYSWNNMVIWYNTKMFNELGIAAPQESWTRNEFLEIAKKLTVDKNNDGKPDQYGFAVEPAYFAGTIPWLFVRGTSLLSEDLSRSNANDPKVIEVMQFLQDLIYKDRVAPTPGFGPTFSLFIAGQVGMFGAGRWPVVTFVQEGFSDCDIQYWPKWDQETPRVTLFGVDGFPLLTTSQHPEQAWKFIKYMIRRDVQSKLIGTKEAPVGNIPARKSLAMSDEIGAFPPKNYKIFYKSLVEFPAKPVPAPVAFTRVEEIWLRYVSAILANEMTAEEGCMKAHQEITKILEEE
ncbi:MAG: sugar ABC transporter substrate-binding protein [Candidatus Caldatribacterium sp.]|nr:sugar ABC transporter substrate-binding protein [Candidatus Caldatribacterium sp.]